MKTEDINRKILETIPHAIIVVNSSYNISYINPAAILMLGYGKKQILGTPFFEYILTEDSVRVKKNLTSKKTDTGTLNNVKFRKKDETIINTELTISCIKNRRSRVITIAASNESCSAETIENKEEIYRSLFERSTSGILYINKEGKTILSNERFVANFNGKKEDFEGKNISEFLPAKVTASVQETIKNKIPCEVEIQLGTPYKQTDFYVFSQPLLDSKNNIFGIMIIFHEASGTKEMQKALRESETRFRRLFENIAQVPVQGYDKDHRVIFWNKASEAAYGYSKEEAMGQTLEDLIIPDPMRTDVFNAIEDFYNRDIPIPSGEIGLKRKDGSIVDMYSSHVIIKNYNGKKEMYCIDVDMSKRIEAEKQIALQARMLNEVGQAVIATNKEGNIIFINSAAEKLYGWTRNDVLNKNIMSLMATQEIKKQAEEFIRKIKKGESWTGEFTAYKKGVGPFTALGTNSPLYDSCGELIGIIGVSVDITDLKNKEKELKLAKEKAEEMSKIKSAFLANMSHELRTPLVGILGSSEILNQEIEHEQHKKIAGSILLSGKRLLSTLNAILDMAKVEANMMELNYSEFSVFTEVKSAVKVFEGLAAKKGLKVAIEGDEFSAELDRNIFLQILDNLIHNALKFTEKGEIRINLKKEYGYFSMFVKDTGIGISPASQDLIFNEFRQVSEGYGRHFEGTGIGLTLTRRFVQLMNGVIYVESELNKGTIFTVRFPLKRQKPNGSYLTRTGIEKYNGVTDEY